MTIQIGPFLFFLAMAERPYHEVRSGEEVGKQQMPFDWRPFAVGWRVGGERPPVSSDEKETNQARFLTIN